MMIGVRSPLLSLLRDDPFTFVDLKIEWDFPHFLDRSAISLGGRPQHTILSGVSTVPVLRPSSIVHGFRVGKVSGIECISGGLDGVVGSGSGNINRLCRLWENVVLLDFGLGVGRPNRPIRSRTVLLSLRSPFGDRRCL